MKRLNTGLSRLAMSGLRLLAFGIFLMSVESHGQSYVELHGGLKVKGNRIVDKNDQAIQLKGMSLFWSQWMGKYYTAGTVKWLKDNWCSSVVRAAMGVETSAGGYAKSDAIAAVETQKVKTVINAAIAEGIYVIVDFHVHKGDSLPFRQAAARFFKDIASSYGDVPNIIYETWNEPTRQSWATAIKPYHEEMIDTIRKYAPSSLVICGTKEWSQKVDEPAANPITKGNVAYTLHYYAASHAQWLRTRAQNALNSGIALFVTEYGTCDASGAGTVNAAESKLWWDFLDANKIGYCNWSIADKVEAASAIKPGASVNGGWDEATQLTESGILVRNKMTASCDWLVGVNDQSQEKTQVSCFPNPFDQTISIEAQGAFGYTVYDVMGAALEQGYAYDKVTVAASLQKGLYLVRISTAKGESLVKIEKK